MASRPEYINTELGVTSHRGTLMALGFAFRIVTICDCVCSWVNIVPVALG